MYRKHHLSQARSVPFFNDYSDGNILTKTALLYFRLIRFTPGANMRTQC